MTDLQPRAERKMPFSKVSDDNLRAEKLSRRGAVYYSVWHDEHEEVYVRVESNEVGGVRKKGTFSRGIFRLSEITANLAMPLPINGFWPESGEPFASRDKDMSGFLRAIKRDILSRSAP